MKRTIAMLSLACALIACSNSTITRAEELPPFRVFWYSANCNEQAMKDLRSDLKTPGVTVAHYIDQESPNARQAQALDDAYSKLSENAYLLTMLGAENDLATKISKRAQARARQLTTKYMKGALPAPILVGQANFDERIILYQCFQDACPVGESCTRVNVTKGAAKLLSAIEAEGRFVRSVIRWAKSARLPKENYNQLMNTFEKNAAFLRKETPKAPQEVFLNTSRVTR